MRAVRVVVRGRVQGVGFRWFVREAARRASLRGWVRNNPDGSVELLASGDGASVDALVAAVRLGPDGAVVDAVEVEDGGEGDALPAPFAVLR